MPKRLAGLTAIVLAAAAFFTAFAYAQSPSATTTAPAKRRAERAKERAALKRNAVHLRKRIRHYRKRTWYWQGMMQKRHFRSYGHESRTLNIRYLKHLVRRWRHRYRHAKWQAHHPPHKWLWLCIHRREGSWKDNASNNPHWGGLQMGIWFMSHYAWKLLHPRGMRGPTVTANNWPPLQQMWVAERAYKREHYSRAWLFSQWVPTASYCI